MISEENSSPPVSAHIKTQAVQSHIIDPTVYGTTCKEQRQRAQPHVLLLSLNNQEQVKQTATEGMFSKELRIQLRVISVH